MSDLGTYEYQPGNGTRYHLLYGNYRDTYGGRKYSITWMTKSTGGLTYVWCEGDQIHAGYFMKKSGITNTADVAAIFAWLRKSGHMTELFKDFDENGVWRPLSSEC